MFDAFETWAQKYPAGSFVEARLVWNAALDAVEAKMPGAKLVSPSAVGNQDQAMNWNLCLSTMSERIAGLRSPLAQPDEAEIARGEAEFVRWWEDKTSDRPDSFPVMVPWIGARAAWYASRLCAQSSLEAGKARVAKLEEELKAAAIIIRALESRP